MRTPRDLGLPAKFAGWRPHQRDAVLTIASSGDGYDALNAPTGSGKSAIYASIAALLEGRTIILTSTKSLQSQLVEEFRSYADIRGQVNYPCELEHGRIQVDEAICHFGVPCALKGGGCTYFDAYRRAIGARVVITNYAYWLSVHEYGEGLGGFDFMVCDEAHNALDEIGAHLSTRITDQEIDAFLERTRPQGGRKEWHAWASSQLLQLEPKLAIEIEDLKRRGSNRSLLRRIHDLKRVVKKLHEVQAIAESSQRWVHEDKDSLTWTPVWPGRASQVLFRGIKKVLLVSATITPKALELLGLSDFRFHEYPSTFAIANRPVVHLRTGVKLRHDTDRLGLKTWLDKIDQVIQFRFDRKGIVHTVSYARRDYILENSRFRGAMITHGRRDARFKIEEFKRAKAPAILVSPSLDTGIDLPYDQARWQIISKVPFPDSRSPVHAARHEDDPDFGMHEAITTLVQASGRIVRAPDDFGETFICDDQILWVVPKYRRFFPRWWLEAYRPNVMVTPPPLRRAV